MNAPADAVAKFYNQAMSAHGWPSGMVMSTPNRSALMIHRDGAQFAVGDQKQVATFDHVHITAGASETITVTFPLME